MQEAGEWLRVAAVRLDDGQHGHLLTGQARESLSGSLADRAQLSCLSVQGHDGPRVGGFASYCLANFVASAPLPRGSRDASVCMSTPKQLVRSTATDDT
eukprot:6632283-Prymnesium_polylepis.1